MKPKLFHSLARSAAAIVAAGILTSGCEKETVHSVTLTPVVEVRSIGDFKPDALPYTDAQIIIYGTNIDARLEADRSEGTLELAILTDDQVVERENYKFSEGSFKFAGTMDDTYDPPVPLVKFPMEVGDTWSWGGTIKSAGIEREATAKIASSNEVLNISGGPYETVLVTVNIWIDADQEEKAERSMKFWFVPGKGIIQRDYEHSMTRTSKPTESMPETEPQ